MREPRPGLEGVERRRAGDRAPGPKSSTAARLPRRRRSRTAPRPQAGPRSGGPIHPGRRVEAPRSAPTPDFHEHWALPFGNTPETDRQTETDRQRHTHTSPRPGRTTQPARRPHRLRAAVSTSETWADECAGGKPVPELLLTPGTLAPTMHLPYTCRT